MKLADICILIGQRIKTISKKYWWFDNLKGRRHLRLFMWTSEYIYYRITGGSIWFEKFCEIPCIGMILWTCIGMLLCTCMLSRPATIQSINSLRNPFYLQSIFRVPVLYPVITVQRKTTIFIWNHVVESKLKKWTRWLRFYTHILQI